MVFAGRVCRPIGVVSACIATAIAFSSVGPAHATPPGGQDQASCVYTLSKPFVVDVSGAKMVSATLTSLPCTGDILPNSQTVCVQLQGVDSAPQCVIKSGYDAAQVFFTPYRPGGTYVSTGTGCGAIGPSLVSACATQGPLSATL